MNNTLPITAFEEAVIISESKYIIIEAETGAGKSTEVARWFMRRGHRVLITEPLVETVLGTSEYVAQLERCKLGSLVGYRTGEYRQAGKKTRLLYCTADLRVVLQEIGGDNNRDILIVDELHEWRNDQSTLEAWAWKKLEDGSSPFKKIVVLSATLDSSRLSRERGNAPVFKIPGRQYPIQNRPRGKSIEDDIRRLVAEGYDVLCFQPGKAEINQTIIYLADCGAELIPFHGDLERSEKDKAYQSWPIPKVIVSTNALETGRTVLPSEGRDLAVVDSGLERRVELIRGVEGLYLKAIAVARGQQRRGRTGRVGEGVYIDHCPTNDRLEYPTPEILRTRLDQQVLRLAQLGLDAENLPFFHQPNLTDIRLAKEDLTNLGCMDFGKVTEIGRKVARMSMISVEFGRMLVEAERLGVVDEVLVIAAILESGEITDRKNAAWMSMIDDEKESDLLAQLAVFNNARGMNKDDMRDHGIHVTAYFKAEQMRRQLTHALRGRIRFGSSGCREDILKAVAAGMVNRLYKGEYGLFKSDGISRELAKESVISRESKWVIGLPWDLQVKRRRGGLMTLNLLRMVTRVNPAILAEVAPHLVREEKGLNASYEAADDTCMSTTRTFFKDQLLSEDRVLDPYHPKAADAFAAWAANQMF